MSEIATERQHYVIWVCPDPDCHYYETHCGISDERFCPVVKIGSRVVHPINAAPRLEYLEVVPV